MGILSNILYKFNLGAEARKFPEYYYVNQFKLNMGKKKHTLSLTQKQNPMYDRFIPFLAGLTVESKGLIIDVGANVGDSIAGMITETNSDFIAIEPMEFFYKLLQENVKRMGAEYAKRITLKKAIVCNHTEKQYELEMKHGTAVMKQGTCIEQNCITLSTLCEEVISTGKRVDLIKIDTDGWDAECILSLGKILEVISPYIYFESQIDNYKEYEQYQKCIQFLQDMNFNCFFVFDNFGNFLFECSAEQVKNIYDYLWRMQMKKSTRTFFYVDILACTQEKSEKCRETIKNYLKSVLD